MKPEVCFHGSSEWVRLVLKHRKLEDVEGLPKQKTAEIYYKQQHIKITKCWKQ